MEHRKFKRRLAELVGDLTAAQVRKLINALSERDTGAEALQFSFRLSPKGEYRPLNANRRFGSRVPNLRSTYDGSSQTADARDLENFWDIRSD